MSGATDELFFGFDMDEFSGGYDMDVAIATTAPPQVDAGVGEAGSTRSDSEKFEDLTKQSERSKQTDEQTEQTEQTGEHTEQPEQTEQAEQNRLTELAIATVAPPQVGASVEETEEKEEEETEENEEILEQAQQEDTDTNNKAEGEGVAEEDAADKDTGLLAGGAPKKNQFSEDSDEETDEEDGALDVEAGEADEAANLSMQQPYPEGVQTDFDKLPLCQELLKNYKPVACWGLLRWLHVLLSQFIILGVLIPHDSDPIDTKSMLLAVFDIGTRKKPIDGIMFLPFDSTSPMTELVVNGRVFDLKALKKLDWPKPLAGNRPVRSTVPPPPM
jgi:hypothetical protein